MTQTAATTNPVDLLAMITSRGSLATEQIKELRRRLPHRNAEITEFARASDDINSASQRLEIKRDVAAQAQNALIYVPSRINLDMLDRLRTAAYRAVPGSNVVDDLYMVIRGMTSADDMPSVETFYIAALLAGHAYAALQTAERVAGELRFNLSRDLDIA